MMSYEEDTFGIMANQCGALRIKSCLSCVMIIISPESMSRELTFDHMCTVLFIIKWIDPELK